MSLGLNFSEKGGSNFILFWTFEIEQFDLSTMKALLQKRDTNQRDKGIFYHKALCVQMSTILLTGFPLVGCCEGLFPDFLALVVEQLEKWHPILPKYPRSCRSIPSDLLDRKVF